MILPILIKVNKTRQIPIEDILMASGAATLALFSCPLKSEDGWKEKLLSWSEGNIEERILFLEDKFWRKAQKIPGANGYFGQASLRMLAPLEEKALQQLFPKKEKQPSLTHKDYNENKEYGFGFYSPEEVGVKVALKETSTSNLAESVKYVTQSTSNLLKESDYKLWSSSSYIYVPFRLGNYYSENEWNIQTENVKAKWGKLG